MADDLTRPYIGYRSAGRRPERQQDRRASADAPLAALRGMISGVAGAPGDIESLVRMLPGLSEQTILPTSEDVERRLPLRSVSETPLGRAVTGAGQLGGGFYTGPGSPLRALAAVPGALRHGAGEFVRAAGQPAVNVIKPKGGNWLAGSVERAIEPMKRADPGRMTEEQLLRGAWENTRPLSESEQSMNRWLENKLAKYIRNEMATPEDPLRALADRGVTHIPEGARALEQVTEWIPETLEGRRAAAGFPRGGMSKTTMGQGWEQLADEAIHNMPARMRVSPETGGGSTKALQVEQENPWLLKVPPETMTYGAYPVEVRQELGFEHLADELRNAINPTSGLPENLRWKYQDLEKVTVPQAVQRVADINAWRAAQKAEADLMRAQNAATFTYKEYPEAGFRWVEIRQPEAEKITQLPEGWRVLEDSNAGQKYHYVVNEHGGTIPGSGFIGKTPEEAIANTIKGLNAKRETQALEDALKYEGETMGHCVGGYCEEVASGQSRIYSLRDKKGQPHVTIETRPMENYELEAAKMKRAGASPEEIAAFFENPPQEIVQIKGKANRAPNPEYLPAVHDFVRSQNWSNVGDLKNTGLVDLQQMGVPAEMRGGQRFVTEDEYKDIVRKNAEGFAEGGAVSAGEDDVSPLDVYKFANRQSLMGNDMSVVGFGAGADVGGGRLDAALEMMRMERAKDIIPQESQNRTARVSYSKQLGDIGLNATALKPLDTENVYLGMINGSIPVGLGRLLLGIQAAKTPWSNGVTGHSIGYSGRVGPGALNANVQRSRSGNVSGNIEYRIPFAEGGQVSGANFPTGDFDPARIDSIVGELHAMNAG